MKLFSCGRLCLFGEHSDWAASYRNLNPNLGKGYAILVGTNQGLYATAKPHPSQFILHPTLSDGSRISSFCLPMEKTALLSMAKKGNFYSYGAGVAYQFLQKYQIQGIEIDNYFTDLPIQKGLSSSAAICILVARAFNQVYDLKLSKLEEMEIAYLGERMTPSQCGRLDQACAYGNQPILMIFDGNNIEIQEFSITQDLFFVIVDLGGNKNTHKILKDLNQCYPYAVNSIQQNVQDYLGSINGKIVQEAIQALKIGNAEQLGDLMTQAQSQFDRYIMPACPEELTAPLLHQILHYSPLQAYIWGGKGVGSQGDGTAQFIAKSKSDQQQVIQIIKQDFPNMSCLELILSNTNESN
ncbi:MAG: GHMP kinase [Microcoleaceae cyanobacterium]